MRALVTIGIPPLAAIAGRFRLELASSLRLRGFTYFVPLAPPPLPRRQLQTEAGRPVVTALAHDAKFQQVENLRYKTLPMGKPNCGT